MASNPNPELMEVENNLPEPKPIEEKSQIFKSKVKDFSLCVSELLPQIGEKDHKSLRWLSAKRIATEDIKYSLPKHSKIKGEIEEEGFEVIETETPNVASAFVNAAISESEKSLTENNAPTFSTSSDALLDFYFGVMDDTSELSTFSFLKKSWLQEPLATLKLVANLRDIRKGKGIRPQYQQCLYWLYQNHPNTLYQNLNNLLEFGYWKDIAHLLTIIIFDGYIHPYFKQDANPQKTKKPKPSPSKYKGQGKKPCQESDKNPHQIRVAYDAEKRTYNQKIADFYSVGGKVSEMTKGEMTGYKLKFAREKLQKDVKYRAFHLKIAELFATQLVQDLKELKKPKDGKLKNISLAGKWAPTLEGHFDRYTLLSSTIALSISKLTGSTLGNNKSNVVATYLARKVYNKEYCIPLRRYHDVPEEKMSEKKWDQVNYKRVPAKSMTKNKPQFLKHDKERFKEYLNCKTSKVAGASLKPVEIICQVMNLNNQSDNAECLVLEKQWDSLVESIQKSGSLLKDAVCICDVSGSMQGVPMQAAIGLTLITMKMTSAPWNSICITFSESPEIFHLDDKMTIVEKLGAMRGMRWGMSTNLHAAFELILSLGVKNKLKNDQMPKLLFIFTDMEFNEACGASSEMTNFDAAKQLFEAQGYTLPTIVFWNLRDSSLGKGKKSTPVKKNEVGALLLSGFAAQTLTYVMNSKDLSEISPLRFMHDVIGDPRYSNLAIYD